MTTSGTANAQSLISLLRQTGLDDHEEILKAANNVLKKSKQDPQALHARIVALLKLDRFDEALHTFEGAGKDLKDSAPLEWAYALYRNGKFAEAQEVVAQNSGRGMKHLEAQLAYRAENFTRAADLYRELSKLPPRLDAPGDLRINSLATDSQLIWSGNGQFVLKTKPGKDDLEACETVYNIACAYVARGELKQAEVLLKRAKDLCNASDLSETEKRADMLPLIVQHIYVLCRLEKLEEAEKLCSSLNISDSPDLSTRHIALTNILSSSNTEKNPYLAQRKFESTSHYPKNDRPFEFQETWLAHNGRVLDLQCGKYGGVVKKNKDSGQSTTSISPQVVDGSICDASARSRNQTGKEALRELLPLLQQRPNDVGLLLTIVQLYILSKNLPAATKTLETFFKRLDASTSAEDLNVRFAPGLVAIAASLYTRQGRNEQTKAELAKAAAYWRDKSKDESVPISLLNAAGTALLSNFPSNDLSTAHTYFSAAYANDPTNPITKAGLVGSSTVNSLPPEELVESLPTVLELIHGIDAAALEEGGIAKMPAPSVEESAASNKRTPADKLDAPKTKKPRKSRLPKDYDPAKKPDPERWLPLRDRSTWRPSRKKGKGRAAMNTGTQGGMGGDEARTASPAAGQVVKVKGKKKGKK